MELRKRERPHSPHAAAAASEISREAMAALARLASIVESSEDAIIGKDLDGTITSWNRGAAGVYGYSADEAIGQSINILVPPDRQDEEQEILVKIRSGQRIHHFDTVRLKKGNIPIDVSLSISPVWEDGRIIGGSHIARDISERKRLEAATARLAAIVESSEDAIVSKDLSGVIETWNAGAERVYGYTAAEAVGRNIAFLLPDDREHEEREILAKLAQGERIEHFETTRRRNDGTLIEVSLTISPIRDSSGKTVGASHVARDITDRKDLEKQMRETQRLESLGVLAGGIAHDFNNLLTGIIGNASLVAEELPPGHALQEYVAGLMGSAQRAADLTSQLLAYSGRGQFVIGPVNLAKLISEIDALIRASIPKNVAVYLDIPRDLPPVEGDQNQLHQLFMNLIINGAEAVGESRPGNVIVRSTLQDLDEHYIRDVLGSDELPPGRYISIEVRDDGCGMDEATKARIFDPFFTTKFLGRGLGLAAALGIVKAHRGAIRVYSTPGHGTIFRIFLPALAGGRSFAPERQTIMVVDDEDVVRQVVRSALETRGYSVIPAANGREALELLRRTPAVALVILDLTMPLMSGEETLRRIREVRPELRVILSSGYSEYEVRRRFGGDAIAAFIQKPYTKSVLRDKVESVLRAR